MGWQYHILIQLWIAATSDSLCCVAFPRLNSPFAWCSHSPIASPLPAPTSPLKVSTLPHHSIWQEAGGSHLINTQEAERERQGERQRQKETERELSWGNKPLKPTFSDIQKQQILIFEADFSQKVLQVLELRFLWKGNSKLSCTHFRYRLHL